ncbi:hypothetical protein IPJ72_01380 [Candidatus Peregrinibacteria bacterium]|nr:MAG: hypothetical protein IPJ72_01380 [Candidatus Peregrinibacteria bacterium]
MPRFFRFFIIILFAIALLFISKPLRAQVFVSDSIDDQFFPFIRFQLSPDEPFVSRQLEIIENNSQNHQPILLLPPHPVLSKIDLFILIDQTQINADQADLIKYQLKSLERFLHRTSISVTFHIHTFGPDDTSSNLSFSTIRDPADFQQLVDDLVFTEPVSPKNYLLNKLYHLTTLPLAPDSQPIALLINPHAFFNADEDVSTTYRISDVASALHQNSFWLFSAGSPISSLVGLKNNVVEDVSLHHSLYGGYLGTLNFPLDQWFDFLLSADHSSYTVQMTSQADAFHIIRLWLI